MSERAGMNELSGSTRVAIDGRTLQDRPLGGVGRSIHGQLDTLAGLVQLTVLLDGRRPGPCELPPGIRVHQLRAPVSGRGFAWLQLAAVRWLRRFDGIFHCPYYGLPYVQPVPMVVTMHDISFEFEPSLFPATNLMAFRRQARWAARTARMIIVDSDHVRASVLEYYGRYGVSEDRVITCRIPLSPGFGRRPPGWEAALDRLALRSPYVVALGGAPRRRLDCAVSAWRAALSQLGASPEDLPLAVVGTEPPASQPGLRYLGALDDGDWAAVLHGAAAFCYATMYEGYGIPAIEAAACGTPVVCARVGALPELLGRGASWAEDLSPQALGAALARVIANIRIAKAISAAASAQVDQLPSWEQQAQATAGAYARAVAA